MAGVEKASKEAEGHFDVIAKIIATTNPRARAVTITRIIAIVRGILMGQSRESVEVSGDIS